MLMTKLTSFGDGPRKGRVEGAALAGNEGGVFVYLIRIIANLRGRFNTLWRTIVRFPCLKAQMDVILNCEIRKTW